MADNGGGQWPVHGDYAPTSEVRESVAPISPDIKVTSNAVGNMAIATDGNCVNIANGCNTTGPGKLSFQNEDPHGRTVDSASGTGTTNVNIAPVPEE